PRPARHGRFPDHVPLRDASGKVRHRPNARRADAQGRARRTRDRAHAGCRAWRSGPSPDAPDARSGRQRFRICQIHLSRRFLRHEGQPLAGSRYTGMSTVADAYFTDLISRFTALKDTLAEPMARAVDAIVETAHRDGLVYVFGTGHSHMLAEEVHFRAGGLALTVPILASATMLHEGAVMGTTYERMEGI